jgi:hypothetical protein
MTAMSRFSRMQNPPLRIWSSPQTAVRIEYSADVLREIRLESTNDEGSGVLLGTRSGDQVRVLAARRAVDEQDPRLAGLGQLGIFALRARGQVFLTESDLALLEEARLTDAIALVIAGSKGGFFVREPDGSMQTIKSYREFSLADTGIETQASSLLIDPPKLLIEVSRANRWAWIFVGCIAMIAVAVMARPYLLPLLPRPPLGLAVREESGALRITWSPAAAAQHASLEIVDGTERKTVALSASLANTIYVPQTPEVKVFLTAAEGRRETAHFVGNAVSPSPPSPDVEHAQAQVADLEAEAETLRVSVEMGRKRLAELQYTLSRMTSSGRIQ